MLSCVLIVRVWRHNATLPFPLRPHVWQSWRTRRCRRRFLTAKGLSPPARLSRTNQTLRQLLQSLAALCSVERLVPRGPHVSFQLSNQSSDPGVRMWLLLDALEQVEHSRLRKSRVDQMDEGQQVLLECCRKQAHQRFTRRKSQKGVRHRNRKLRWH